MTGIFTPPEMLANLDEIMQIIDAAAAKDEVRQARKAAQEAGAARTEES